MSLASWQLEPWQRLRAARDAGRLAHGLLFCGPAELGQRELADRLAALLLCEAPADGGACGRCRACRLRLAGTHADLNVVTLIERDDGKLKSEIGVDQIRALSAWFALTPQLGRAQVAILDPADVLNTSAANALLKTLEEPLPGRYLLLVCARIERLPATIRSRCQRIELRVPAAPQALAWLVAQGVADHDAHEALAAADGHPGVALRYLRDGSLGLRRTVLAELDALAQGRASASQLAAQWMADQPEARLRFAAEAVRDLGRARAAAAPPASLGLKVQGDFHKLARWYERANQARDWLAVPLRHELLLTELLQAWRQAAT